jgi:N-acetylmuramoyl-L-alanine amidase
MTRETRDSLASPFASNRKREDMEKRRQIIEKVKPDLVISIHLNSFPMHTAIRGLQTFYSASNNAEQNTENQENAAPTSRVYAEAIQNEFNQSNLNINRQATAADFYMLECTEFPSVLVECGFLSNPEEERLLKTAEYQKIIAKYIADAICKL